MKNFNGKAIYNPSGKAGEYSYWACNFYVGCSNGCEYCYCKKGILAGVMGQDIPQLKKCFKNKDHALEIFRKELLQNRHELKKHGLFFSFTTDPFLTETKQITKEAIEICIYWDVPVKILTKRADMINEFIITGNEIAKEGGYFTNSDKIAIGFTLTGHDELELGASTNQERIEAMKKLHDAGFKTFASLEPIIDIDSTYEMIKRLSIRKCCDLYKIGLLSGNPLYKDSFGKFVYGQAIRQWSSLLHDYKVYFKDSFLRAAGIDREQLPKNCVTRDYNIFHN
jgi:DNA repair photolyase